MRLMPLLKETGCRLAEIVGLELDEIESHIHTPQQYKATKDSKQHKDIAIARVCERGHAIGITTS